MAYTAISIDCFIAAYSGALGGMRSQRGVSQNTSPGHFAHICEVALAFAEAFDTEYASVLPNELQLEEIESICSEQMAGRQPGSPSATTAAFWVKPVQSIIALMSEADAVVAANVVNPIPVPTPISVGVINIATVVGASDSLKSITPVTGIAAIVEGYATSGDGGGGEFFWSPTSAAADDGGTIINPTGHVGNGRWIRIFSGAYNVRWFGMLPTATAAVNTTAFIATVASNRDVYLPQGVYSFLVPSLGTTAGTTFFQNLTNVRIFGDGKYQTRLVDPQAPGVLDFAGNPNGHNAFWTFQDCVDIEISDIGFQGALVWNQNSISNVVVVASRKGLYFKSSALGCQNCWVHDCFFTLVEGEVIYADGSVAFPAVDIRADGGNHFYRCLTNHFNIAAGNILGSFRCGLRDALIESPGNGSVIQAGGTDGFCIGNQINWEGGGLFSGSNLTVLGSIKGYRIEDNDFSNFVFVAGVNVIGFGVGGGVEGCFDVSIQRNRIRNVQLLGQFSATASVIGIDSSVADITGFICKDNVITQCSAQDPVNYPNPIAIRLLGANDISGIIEGNTIDNEGVANGISRGIVFNDEVLITNGVEIGANFGFDALSVPVKFMNLAAWYNPDFGITTVAGKVSVCEDQWDPAGTGANDVAQAVAGSRPLYGLSAAFGDKNVLTYVGATPTSLGRTTTILVPQSSARTILTACRPTDAAGGTIIDFQNDAQDFAFQWYNAAPNLYVFGDTIVNLQILTADVYKFQNRPVQLTFRDTGTGNPLELRVNGIFIPTTGGNVPAESVPPGGFTLGDRLPYGQAFTGEMGDVIVYARALQPKEMAVHEQYLKTKYRLGGAAS